MKNLQYLKRDPEEEEPEEQETDDDGLPHPPTVPIKPPHQNFK